MATRLIRGKAWQAYYDPLQTRIEILRPAAPPDLLATLVDAQREIELWRAAPEEIAYLLALVRPHVD